MKIIISSRFSKYVLVVFFLAISNLGYSQKEKEKSSNKEPIVKKRTILEQFESDLVISPEERMKLKIERAAVIQERLEIMDTLELSDRQRRKLLKELYRSPFSDKWNKVIAGLEFEEEKR